MSNLKKRMTNLLVSYQLIVLSWLPADARVSSASHQRPQLTGLAAAGQAGTNRPTRHRKVSRSAGPSPAALRNALKISGGEYRKNIFIHTVLS